MDDSRGPFTGTHSHTPAPVLPPQWDMTTTEYREARERDAIFYGDHVAPLSAGASAVGGAVAWPMFLHHSDLVHSNGFVALGVMAATGLHVLGGLMASCAAAEYLSWRRHDFTELGDKDPALVVDIGAFPHGIGEVILTLADISPDVSRERPEERARRLEMAYRNAKAFAEAFAEQDAAGVSPSSHTGVSGRLVWLHSHCRAELEALVAYATTVEDPWVTRAAASLAMQLNVLDNTTPATTMTTQAFDTLDTTGTTAPSRGALSAHQRWNDAREKHERVIEAWTAIVTDPLAALDHTLLLDVTQPRTAAFIEAYGHAQDLAAIHGDDMPDGESEQRAYVTAVRKADEAWTEAVRHARHVHLNWLPAAEERRARQAKGLLATAADEDVPVHLRADAAAKAAELLSKVASFVLPQPTMLALNSSLRALEAANTI